MVLPVSRKAHCGGVQDQTNARQREAEKVGLGGTDRIHVSYKTGIEGDGRGDDD